MWNIKKIIDIIKRPSVSFKGYTSAFALILFIVIISSCAYFMTSISKKLQILDNLKTIRENINIEYEVLLTFDCLLKEYEKEILYDEEGEEIIDLNDEIIIDDFYTSNVYVRVINEKSYYLLDFNNTRLKVYGDNEGISDYEYE